MVLGFFYRKKVIQDSVFVWTVCIEACEFQSYESICVLDAINTENTAKNTSDGYLHSQPKT